MTCRIRGGALLLALLLASAPALAKSYKVHRGDTYASIAEEEFGDPGLGRLLALHNGGREEAAPEPGERVQLPEGRVLRLMLPQRFSDLAERVLNDPSLEALLARINGRPVAELIPFLEVIVIPAFLELPRVPGESHADVARRVYGPDAPAWPVELANVERLDHVRVPVVGFFDETLADAKAVAVDEARRRLVAAPRGTATPPSVAAAARERPADGDGAEETGVRPAEAASAPSTTEPVPTATVARREPAPEKPPEPTPPETRPVPNPSAEPRPTAVAQVTERRSTETARAEPRSADAAHSTKSRSTPPPGPSPPSIPAPAPQDREPPEPSPAPAAAATAVLSEPRPAIPDPIPWGPLERVRRAYERGEFHRAEVDGRSVIDSGEVPPELQPTAWLLLGLAELARGRDAEARTSFGRARAGDPSLELDPFYFSPKVREAFHRAGPGR